MSGHVSVVGADLTRLSCDDVLVPTGCNLSISPGWCPLLPAELVSGTDDAGASVGLAWEAGERVLEVPGDGPRRTWLVDTVDDEGRGLPWLLEGAREALAAVARREVPEPAHGRARRLVGLPALGTGWGGAAGMRSSCCSSCCRCSGRRRRRTGSTWPWCSSSPATWRRPSGSGGVRTAAGTCPSTCRSWPGSWATAPAAGSWPSSWAPGSARRRGCPPGSSWSTSWPRAPAWTTRCGRGSPGCRPRTPPHCWPGSWVRRRWSPTSRSGSGRVRTRWPTR